jgi:dTMP kinase
MKAASARTLERFIVLEGGDGAGTTTQLKRLGEALEAAGVPHWITAEPTDGPEGRLIRRILSGELPRDPGTLARLFAADRNEHLRGSGGILERLERGEAVVCDRYVLSSLVYQGVACGRELPAELNAGFPYPELLLYFDLAPEQSLGRLGGRERLDIFEELPFQERVRAAYRAELASYAAPGMAIATVDASRGVEEVCRDVLGTVGRALGVELLPFSTRAT